MINSEHTRCPVRLEMKLFPKIKGDLSKEESTGRENGGVCIIISVKTTHKTHQPLSSRRVIMDDTRYEYIIWFPRARGRTYA